EVSPANTAAAFLDDSIESLVIPLSLPIYDGYDGLDELQLTFLTLPSGETVTLASYLNSPQPGTSIHIDSAMQNIPQVVFESCQQLQVSREEVLWFNPDWQEEIDRLYAEHGNIEKRPELLHVEEPQSILYEPIDCFNHALRIYTREYIPATYWAMLQRNLGLAYQNRSQGDRRDNLERSIDCFNQSLAIFTQNDFPDEWKINYHDLDNSKDLLKEVLAKDIFARQIPYRKLKGVDLSHIYVENQRKRSHAPYPEYPSQGSAYLMGADLRQANFTKTRLDGANLINADLSEANLQNADLREANLMGANLSYANLDCSFLIDTKFNRAKLYHANLSGAKLTQADLSDANLSHANLICADLTHSNLSNADLSNADLRCAKLMFTNLSGANLNGAEVNDAQFRNNSGISELMRQDLIDRGAIFDDTSGDRSESKNLVPC
ncbi:pentapeptide repeat-containing protein, partial [Chamaesiphon sp. OTE_75_metabat_556]|uniref:pentapeptide repeat-containing protein n=1 Tax=Chamaesiphon sp. OTE_75_metabat_556 TaxID=2964692 RepID=UPI00286A1C03